MKLAKLSLAAIVVAGLASSSFAADSLADAFKNGKVNGELKAYYFSNHRGADDQGTVALGDDTKAGTSDIFTTGILLGYKTDSLHGFSLGFTAQGSSSPFADSQAKGTAVNQNTASFEGSMYGPGAVLSEAYLAYTMKNTTVMVGRMFLETPLVASSGGRVVKDAFEGAAVINKDLPNTTLIAGYVQKMQDRTDGQGLSIGAFSKNIVSGSGVAGGVRAEDGAYTLAAINTSIPGLTLTAAYADVVDIIQVAYAEAAYEVAAGNMKYGLAAQYYYNNLDDNTVNDNNNFWALKASLGYNEFGAYLAYSKVNNKANGLGVVTGLGNGADLAYTGSPIGSFSYDNDTEAYKIGATYAVTKNANLGVNYTVNEIDVDNYKGTFIALEGDYAFEGSLKGLSLTAIYEDGGKDASAADSLWLKANYKF